MTTQTILHSEATWLIISALVGYISNTLVSRGTVARLPPTSPWKRAIRALHGFLDRVDPQG